MLNLSKSFCEAKLCTDNFSFLKDLKIKNLYEPWPTLLWVLINTSHDMFQSRFSLFWNYSLNLFHCRYQLLHQLLYFKSYLWTFLFLSVFGLYLSAHVSWLEISNYSHRGRTGRNKMTLCFTLFSFKIIFWILKW